MEECRLAGWLEGYCCPGAEVRLQEALQLRWIPTLQTSCADWGGGASWQFPPASVVQCSAGSRDW